MIDPVDAIWPEIVEAFAFYGDPRLPKRFWSKVEIVTSGCWEWTGGKNQFGYGRFKINGVLQVAHRVAYERLVEEISSETPDLDHLCRVRHCVNPLHLEPVTHRENCLRGGNAIKTHCPQGHAYTESNTILYKNSCGNPGRRCRICKGRQSRDDYHERCLDPIYRKKLALRQRDRRERLRGSVNA